MIELWGSAPFVSWIYGDHSLITITMYFFVKVFCRFLGVWCQPHGGCCRVSPYDPHTLFSLFPHREMVHSFVHEQEMSLAVRSVQRTRVGVSAPVLWRRGYERVGWVKNMKRWNRKGNRGSAGRRWTVGVSGRTPVLVLWVCPSIC